MQRTAALSFDGAKGSGNRAENHWGAHHVCCQAIGDPLLRRLSHLPAPPTNSLRSQTQHVDEEQTNHELKYDSLADGVTGDALSHLPIRPVHVGLKVVLLTLHQ